MDRRDTRLALRTTGALVAVIAVAAFAYWSSFGPNAARYEAAAKIVLAQSPGDDPLNVIDLPSEYERLSKDGEAWCIATGGHRYVFFPQDVERPNFYSGYFYSEDGSKPPSTVLDETRDRAKRLGTMWWKGLLESRWLASGAGGMHLSTCKVRAVPETRCAAMQST